MVREARAAEAKGNLEHAYVLYMRFVTLVVQKLPSHPEYAYAKDKNEAKLRADIICKIFVVHVLIMLLIQCFVVDELTGLRKKSRGKNCTKRSCKKAS